ncbi:MAG: magnesium and cobalt transport protein CorA [Bacteroidetes bacterium RIFOXYB2_FULL_35_7]|nr:MAG: magnesium and cobalt transport protein CorA [Bacteroidetes bacterium GWF2_35_48]OFY95743.1 MAG: magnesium and cobalt transport protein CorA [Bacteroidetes bacterium RIFOXYC12_FULL_35_7]OFY96538.1 MAG: magnesium and cobalt transport protein CorA [Bacteroidetes bacterium RIFOXYB2_FULL_35_7]
MVKRKQRFTRKVGFPPESLIYTGDKKIDPSIINLVVYNGFCCQSMVSENFQQIISEIKPDCVNWINLNSLNKIDLIEKIGAHFEIHNLVLEDILNSEQLPKFEETKNHLFITLKYLRYKETEPAIEASHISFILGKNYLITFSEEECDLFRLIRENILAGKGKFRQRNTDYLFYVLLDAIVDNYYLVYESMQDKIETLEDKIIENKFGNLIQEIHKLKKVLSSTRKSIYPLTEAFNKLILDKSEFISPLMMPYINDVHDHIIQLTDLYEHSYEMLASHIDLNMSNMNNNMNNVIKTLTIVSTIFIPLTFIVGVYGMNFKYMPEISWPYSYPVLIALMFLISGTMLIIMKKKKWF